MSSEESQLRARPRGLVNTGGATVTMLRIERQATSGLKSRFKKLDWYDKVDEDDDTATFTFSGGVVSLICVAVMGILALSETGRYLFASRSEHILVDKTKQGRIDIDFHITFHHLACEDVHVDVMDAAGEQQFDAMQSYAKQRIDRDGFHIGRPFLDKRSTKEIVINVPGLGQVLMQPFNEEQAHERQLEEGCEIRGQVHVQKVSGNFHVSIGEAFGHGDRHVHNFKLDDLRYFNTSHTIHALAFGPHYSGLSSPLEGTSSIVGRRPDADPLVLTTGLHHYYITLVPTVHVGLFGYQTATYQYAVTKRDERLELGPTTKSFTMPGVFFIYQLSAFMLRVEDTSVPLLRYLTNMFAILGGVVAIARVINAAAFQFGKVSSTRLTRGMSM